jgi:pyoverdine/dityrosine biosynthesis protein Dit1
MYILVGVDDDRVDSYDARLIEVYRERYPSEADRKAIQFKGLKDIFFMNKEIANTFTSSLIEDVDVPHPVKTKLTDDAELCRKILMQMNQIDRSYVRKLITEQEPHALQLYRGQSRFMLEDLADHECMKGLSKNKRKTVASNVAFEMIARNQAYSNLIELLLPSYVRLSIHA